MTKKACLLPTSFDLEQEARHWEGKALVVKTMSVPTTTDVEEI